NFGTQVGVYAAVALLFDYLLNVAVGISAGIGAVVSAVPALQPYTLTLCLIVLFTLTVINLRGVRNTGVIFLFPLILFEGCLSITMVVAFYKLFLGASGAVDVVIAPPPIPAATSNVSIFLLLGAFASGLTAMTGIEAVSNAVPIFRKPVVRN